MFSHATTLVTWLETKQHRCNLVALVPVKGQVPLVNLEGVPYLFCNKILSPHQDPCTIQWDLVASGHGVFLEGWADGVPSICVLTELEVDTKCPGCLSHIFFPTRGIASFSTGCRPGWLSFPHILKIARMTSTHWPHQHFELLSFLAQARQHVIYYKRWRDQTKTFVGLDLQVYWLAQPLLSHTYCVSNSYKEYSSNTVCIPTARPSSLFWKANSNPNSTQHHYEHVSSSPFPWCLALGLPPSNNYALWQQLVALRDKSTSTEKS